MSDGLLIHARGLTKTYRMHKRPAARIANLFSRDKATTDLAPGEVYHALRGIDLDIRRGEKVAIIGRNGAGKSTLLKIITGVIKPTTGSIDVRGKSHALLSLGACFHPDFTGRENAEAFLAHMGVSGKKAQELVSDAVEFAEIEEHIDQPLKTYSTGMQARLMFAVSTALNPELLVIDEVLGVGDAYFQHKSFERIREMCAGGETTLLIVSHDIYSAAKLVDRVVWIEKGRVMGDGNPADTIKAYENSIRLQEDARQKQKLALAFRRSLNDRKAQLPAFIEIRARGNEPARSPVYFAQAGLKLPGGAAVPFPLFTPAGEAAAPVSEFSAQLLPHLPWGALSEVDGVPVKPWNNFGAVDHKAGFAVFPLTPAASGQLAGAALTLRLRANDVVDADIVYIAPDGSERILHRLITAPDEWQELTLLLAEGNEITASAKEQSLSLEGDRQGSGRVAMLNFEILNHEQKPTFLLEHQKSAVFKIAFEVRDPNLKEKVQVLLAFRRNGIDDIARVLCRDLLITAQNDSTQTVSASFDSFDLGPGRYTMTVLMCREGYFETQTGLFYSINPDVYESRRDALEFEVVDHASTLSSGTGVVLRAKWSKNQ